MLHDLKSASARNACQKRLHVANFGTTKQHNVTKSSLEFSHQKDYSNNPSGYIAGATPAAAQFAGGGALRYIWIHIHNSLCSLLYINNVAEPAEPRFYAVSVSANSNSNWKMCATNFVKRKAFVLIPDLSKTLILFTPRASPILRAKWIPGFWFFYV